MMVDKLKSKVTNPYLKDNFNLENIANFFANFVSGNSFMNNLQVKELTELNNVEINENLKVKKEAKLENLNVNNLKSKVMTIKDNEIILDPEGVLKLKGSNIDYKVKDVFEVITFMKFIVKICGAKLEKCDFNNLLKEHSTHKETIINNNNKQKNEADKLLLKDEDQYNKNLNTINGDDIKFKQSNLNIYI